MKPKVEFSLAFILPALMLSLAFSSPIAAQPGLEGPGSGLVAWWKFVEISGGTIYDSSGNGNNGLVIGAPAWTRGPATGALSFNGITDYIRIPLNTSLGLGIKTVAVWANMSNFLKRYSSVFGWGRGTGCLDNYHTYVTNTGSCYASYQNATDTATVRPTAPIAGPGTWKLGEWAHWAIVYNASGSSVTISLYKNGVLAGTPYTGADGLSSKCHMTAIGSQEDLPNPDYIRTFAGIISDYRIYNRALSASEIYELYSQSRITSADNTAPSTPAGLTATAESYDKINLSWDNSSDTSGVAGYIIYRGGAPIATVRSGAKYCDTAHSPSTIFYYTLTPSTTYTYAVAAYDAAYNVSGLSAAASATTLPATARPNYDLIVTILGTGTGTVTSSPAGMSCRSGTCSASFSAGTSVILSPYPFILAQTARNPAFTGWTGAGCSGIGECQIIMNSNKAVSAYYTIPVVSNSYDVNGDGVITVLDFQVMVNIVLGSAACPGNCDVNNDGILNILDVQAIVLKILEIGSI